MSSRANYLSKYLDTDSDIKKKKKKKNKKLDSTNIIIANDSIINNFSTNIDNDDNDIDEDTPVKVNLGASKGFKGFKRIDDNKIVDKEAINTMDEGKNEQPSTIYRDLTGKIIDIDERRKQLESAKQRQKEHESYQQSINLSELTKLDNEQLQEKLKSNKSFQISKDDIEYNQLMKSKDRVDDPLSTFTDNPKLSGTNVSRTGKYYYNKGISPINRFDIKAGYYWDGIDRSNGFEEVLVKKRQDIKFTKMSSKLGENYEDIDFD